MNDNTRYGSEIAKAAHHALANALKVAQGNRTKAAQHLGIHRTHFLKLCKRHGVEMAESETTQTHQRLGRF